MFLKTCFSYLKHGSLWTNRIATYAVLIAGLVFLALVIGLRYLVLPHVNEYREPIAQTISRAVGQRVTIGSITGSWQGYRPEMTFTDVKVIGADGQPALALERVSTVLSWLSLLSAEWRFDALAVYGPTLEVKRDASGVLWIAGIAIKPQDDGAGGGFVDWLLAQRQVLVRDATITWLDEMRSAPKLQLDKVNVRLDRDGAIHRFGLTAVPPAQLASPLVARGEFVGRDIRELQSLNGRLYAEIDYANLVLAQTWIPAPLELSSGFGSLRFWLELNGARLGAATADLRLVNVQTRLAPDLPDLALSEVHGRLGWTRRGDRTEISANALGFTATGGLRLAPMDFSYAFSAPAGGVRQSVVHLSGLDLAPVAQLVEFLPLDASLRERMARTAPTGTVDEATISWQGDWSAGQAYAAKARFAGLSARPDGGLPGFHGVSGQFDANERAGTATLTVTRGGVELPKIFAEPLPLDFLTANAGWTFHEGVVDVAIKNASFTNEHLAGSVSGSYHAAEGRGSADLSGMLVRADAHQIWRYMPVSAPVTQAWLKRALLAGESKETRFRLKGPLKEFPFAGDQSGLFEVTTKLSGMTLDFADGWPPITGINGDAVFRGDRMEAHVRAGTSLGLQLSDVQASIAELGKHDEHLLVKGVVQGATPDFLRYTAATPLASHINRFTEGLKAVGDARLDLDLDLPLLRARESAVKGELTVRNNQVTLDSRLPPFENFGARIAFTERDLIVRDGHALMFGEPLSFEASNQADGAIVASVTGTLDVDKARAVWKHRALAFLDGQMSWRGTIGVRNKIATLRFDSDLVGLKSTLPPPFAKAAAASLPLRVELRERPGRQGVLAINLDKVASAQLLLDASAPSGVGRGTVSLGGAATLPAADGLWLRGSLDVVDTEVWQDLLSGGSVDGQPGLAGVDLQIGILDVNRRQFHDLKVKATREDDEWQATLEGREVAGELSWISGGDGKLAARLSKFALPPITTEIHAGRAPTEQRLPSVDLVAESFTYEGKDLGRLSVLAQPEASGWQLQHLEITNPDSKFSMAGHWALWEMSRTDVTVRLDVADIGKFFTRLGWPDAMKGGTATLEGPISWSGNPTRLDIPSLSGKLKLEAKDGRFRQIEPGVAKLLGILSLQALPRRVTLDFRDVFSKGFSFDRISANVNINSGLADTQNFLMEGSAARVVMHGQVDLARETQDLIVRVTPSLSEGIAIAGAIVNPAIGVAALIAQKALKDPFSQIASFEYAVSGTWVDPVIARVSKGPSSNTKEKGR